MRQSRAKCIFKMHQACDVLLQDSEFVEQHKGLLASSSVKVRTAKDFSVQGVTSSSEWLAAGPAALNGSCSAWPNEAVWSADRPGLHPAPSQYWVSALSVSLYSLYSAM